MARVALILLVGLTACSSGGGGGSAPTSTLPPVINQSVGGIWRGTRPNGTDIVILVSETGEFRVLDPFGNQGFGQAIVTNQTDVAIAYPLAPPFGDTLIDGSASASCSATGSIQERQSFNFDVACTTSLGGSLGGPASPNYDPIYDRNSSIAMIVGSYNNLGDVLTVDANGALFEQNTQTGCVLNGQIAIIDPDWNLYDVSFTTENCQGINAPLSDAMWNGLATLIDDQGTETVLGGFTTDVGGTLVSLVVALPRI